MSKRYRVHLLVVVAAAVVMSSAAAAFAADRVVLGEVFSGIG
jgi:hypothetical protein